MLNRRIEILKPVLCNDSSIVKLSAETERSIQELTKWLTEALGDISLKQAQSGIVIRKDREGHYLWHNDKAFDLSPKGKTLVGLKDEQISPAKAKHYRAGDLQVMKTNKRERFIEKIHFCSHGYYEAWAEIIPVHNDMGNSDGVLLFSHINFRLKEQPLVAALKLIRFPRNYGLLQFDTYEFEYKELKISLSQKESEVALGLLVGMSSSEISKTMDIKTRTVESYINQIKNKFGTHKKTELVHQLLESTFVDII